MTFKQIYQEEKEKPSPAQAFISHIAEITCREESTIRQWLSGTQKPNKRAMLAIAKDYNSTIEELFPGIDINENESED